MLLIHRIGIVIIGFNEIEKDLRMTMGYSFSLYNQNNCKIAIGLHRREIVRQRSL